MTTLTIVKHSQFSNHAEVDALYKVAHNREFLVHDLAR